MSDVWDAGCWGWGMLGIWDVADVGCSRCRMFGMRDVGCGIFAGMWDVDLQNALRGHEIFYEFSNQTFPLHGYEICSSFLCALNLPEF